MTNPGGIYGIDFATAPKFETKHYWQTKIPGWNEEEYKVDRVFYKSKDGTEIPAFAVRQKSVLPTMDSKPEKPIPTLVYVYGGFGESMDLSFSQSRNIWMKNYGGMYVVAAIRGGGEYGEEWHQKGMKDKRQNVFDDLAFCAKYLQEKGYTTPEFTAINGGSNGGTVVAATANQHPELFGAVVSEVPVTDMLRFQKFTIGSAWVPEYGSSEAGGFDYLYSYSPVHTVKRVKYPAMLVTTGDHDDRVVPLHAYKYVAALQDIAGAVPGQSPLLLSLEKNGGHSGGASVAAAIDERARMYGFLARIMKL
jgi:prolyl oligopeptidase